MVSQVLVGKVDREHKEIRKNLSANMFILMLHFRDTYRVFNKSKNVGNVQKTEILE